MSKWDREKDFEKTLLRTQTGSKASYIPEAGRLRLSYKATPPNLISHSLTQNQNTTCPAQDKARGICTYSTGNTLHYFMLHLPRVIQVLKTRREHTERWKTQKHLEKSVGPSH